MGNTALKATSDVGITDRRGKVVVIAGPDGSGKSSLAASLTERLTSLGHPVRHFHHRLRALPASAASLRPTTAPHAAAPYPAWLSTIKVLYLFADELLGWFAKVRPFRRRGGWVVIERGWWDLAVDPARYRVRNNEGLVRRLGRLLPAPDMTIILSTDEDVINKRKTELTPTELTRQLETWRSLATGVPRAAVIDAAEPVDEIVDSLGQALGLGRRAS
jgi:thymidylate kinase